jgi:predicted dienelactone hydrolase
MGALHRPASPRLAILALAALALVACDKPPGRPEKVGLTATQYVDTARQRPLGVRIWYPAVPEAVEEPASYERAFRGWVAPEAPYRDAPPRPLVLLSHGDRGGNTHQAWLAEALASRGYIVAAVEHWGNTRLQNSIEATLRAWDRPLDVRFVLSRLLEDGAWKGRIDASRVGAAGYSGGGYTVLALAGARYEPPRMGEYCARQPVPSDCRWLQDFDTSRFDWSEAARDYSDPRVGAVAAFAPALGPGMTPESLRAISIPVLLAATQDDEILPIEAHAARYARDIPGARFEALPVGGHFLFMPECTLVGTVFTWTKPFDVCGHRHDVDRHEAHRMLAADAHRFFASSLARR